MKKLFLLITITFISFTYIRAQETSMNRNTGLGVTMGTYSAPGFAIRHFGHNNFGEKLTLIPPIFAHNELYFFDLGVTLYRTLNYNPKVGRISAAFSASYMYIGERSLIYGAGLGIEGEQFWGNGGFIVAFGWNIYNYTESYSDGDYLSIFIGLPSVEISYVYYIK